MYQSMGRPMRTSPSRIPTPTTRGTRSTAGASSGGKYTS
jgi:hypothetical protein